MYNPVIYLVFFFLFFTTINAQDLSRQHALEKNLSNHLHYLASDSLKGRGVNSPEIDLAAEYIRSKLQGLDILLPENGYFQPFTLTSLHTARDKSFLKVLNQKGRIKKNIEHFIAFNQNSNELDIQGELIFAGFGTINSISADKNTQKIDIKDKIILYSAGTSETFKEGNSHRLDNALERKKMEEMKNAGAKALILVTSIQDSANTTYKQILNITERQKFTLNPKKENKLPDIFIVNPETADEITGKKLKWGSALKSVSENEHPNLYALKNNRVHIRSVLSEQNVEAKNVIAIIEGSDSLLKNECIVFVSHYDHLGTLENGDIYNGADDNASGVATLLEVAKMFSNLPEKPKRSLLFLFPTAEEIGLFGSEYYSSNPLFPMEKTVTCINLDMVGRVYEERDSVWSDSPKQVKDFNGVYTLVNDFNKTLKRITQETCTELELIPDFSLPQQFFFTSDHYHFHKNQVPVLNLSTGYTADYHKPTDTTDRIRTDKMKRIVQLCFKLGMKLGNNEL